jgi:hypothetical protein
VRIPGRGRQHVHVVPSRDLLGQKTASVLWADADISAVARGDERKLH